MKKISLSVIVIISVVGCASPKVAEIPIAQPPVKIAEPPKEIIVPIPYWYSQTPRNEGILYAVGTASSRDLQMSQDMAILNAKTNLADRLNSRVRSQTKMYSNQSSSDDNIKNRQQIERTTRNTINDVDVAGYVVAKSETQQVNGVFRTFVMLEYSREQAADLIMERIRGDRSQEPKSDVDRAFEELDKLDIRESKQ
jgi:hypothetical protein